MPRNARAMLILLLPILVVFTAANANFAFAQLQNLDRSWPERDVIVHAPKYAEQPIQQMLLCPTFVERNQLAFSFTHRDGLGIPGLALFIADDSRGDAVWDCASHMASARYACLDSPKILFALTSNNPAMVRGVLKLLLRSKVLRENAADKVEPDSGPIGPEFIPIFVARTLQSSPTNQRLAINVLTKYPQQHRCALLALLELLNGEDAVAEDAHQALQILDGDRYRNTTQSHPRNSAGLPKLAALAEYKQLVEQDKLSEMETAESELGFLHSWQSEREEIPLKIEKWLSKRCATLKISTIAKWCYIHEYPVYHTTIVAQMHEKGFLTLYQISKLLEHEDIQVVMGAATMLENLVNNNLMGKVDTRFWANCLGRAKLLHPGSALEMSGAISGLGENSFTENAFFRYFAQDLLSEDGNLVCETRVILTEITPDCANELGLTRELCPYGNDHAPVLTFRERQKVQQAIESHRFGK